MNALTPHLRIERQLTEGVLDRGLMQRGGGAARALEALRTVGIAEPEARLRQYPHELSGGMRQRVAIAVALMTPPTAAGRRRADHRARRHGAGANPRRAARVARRRGIALVIITHDLGVVAGLADRVAVMYAGRLVESAPADTLFAAPAPSRTRRAAGVDAAA